MNLLEFNKDNPPPIGTPDAKGTPFDPGKHLPRVNAKTQRWLPRSPGRFNKGQTRLPGVEAATQTPPPAADAPPVAEVTASDLIDLPTTPAAAPKADIAPGSPPPPQQTPPPAAAPVPEVGPQDEKTAPGAGAEAPRGADAKASAAHAGKLAARATYAVTGAMIRDHKAAKPTPDEHTALVNTWTAFFEFRGVALVGVFAVGAAVLCYLLEDGRREPFVDFVKGLFRKKGEKRAEPVATPATSAGAPAPAPTPHSVHHVRFPE
jgi:hypothetical protein